MASQRFRSYRLLRVQYDHLLPHEYSASPTPTKPATARSACHSSTESSNVSGFYRLPREVRDHIYSHLIYEPVSFLEVAMMRWQNWGSERSDEVDVGSHINWNWPFDRRTTIVEAPRDFDYLLTLISTCSRMRRDLLPYIYQSPIFSYLEPHYGSGSIPSLDVLGSFHAFLFPFIKQSIRKIHIDLLPLIDFPSAKRVTDIFSDFDNLEEVELDFPHELALTPAPHRLWYRPTLLWLQKIHNACPKLLFAYHSPLRGVKDYPFWIVLTRYALEERDSELEDFWTRLSINAELKKRNMAPLGVRMLMPEDVTDEYYDAVPDDDEVDDTSDSESDSDSSMMDYKQ
jgi:hypothetical protein